MKRHGLPAFILPVLLAGHGAQACNILDQQREISNGEETITGTCSSNGAPVTCSYRQGNGWTCEGPGGHSTSLGNPEPALASACGCDTTPRW